MTPRLDPAGPQPVAAAAPVAGVAAIAQARQQGGQPSLATLLGQTLPAQVLARLNDGSFLVNVAGGAWRMALPAGTRVGAELPMTLVQAGPEPTFTVPAARGAALARVTASLAGDGVAGSAAPAQEARLSDTARVLAAVLRTAGQVPGAAALVGSAPLAGTAPSDPAQLAQRLQATVAQSGLFYESHVAEWAEGRRSLALLAQEPQMEKPPASPLLDPQSAQFVSLQLATQEQARVAWHGQFGPGQAFEWRIEKEPHGQSRPDEAAPDDGWRSELKLAFARLGEVGATVVLRDGQVHIALRAADGAAAALLRARAAGLDAGLAAAGTPLAALHIAAPAPGDA